MTTGICSFDPLVSFVVYTSSVINANNFTTRNVKGFDCLSSKPQDSAEFEYSCFGSTVPNLALDGMRIVLDLAEADDLTFTSFQLGEPCLSNNDDFTIRDENNRILDGNCVCVLEQCSLFMQKTRSLDIIPVMTKWLPCPTEAPTLGTPSNEDRIVESGNETDKITTLLVSTLVPIIIVLLLGYLVRRKQVEKESKEKVVPAESDRRILGMMQGTNKKGNTGFARTNVLVLGQNEGDSHVLEESEGVKIMKFITPQLFESLHQLYLPFTDAILVVVDFALYKKDSEKAIEKVSRWLEPLSGSTRTMKMLVVGSGVDKIEPEVLPNINQGIQKFVSKYHNLTLISNPNENSFFNSADINKVIENLAKEGESKEIPSTWQHYMAVIQRDLGTVSSMKELEAKAQEMYFHKEETQRLLSFISERGVLISFKETLKSRDNVLLKPEWLLDSIGSFICDDRNKTAAETDFLLSVYKQRGLLTNSLLEVMVQEKHLSSRELFFLFNVCQMMLIVTRLNIVPEILKNHMERNEFCWLVPSMNKVEKLQSEVASSPNVTTGEITWKEPVPKGLFPKCICAVLSQQVPELKFMEMCKTTVKIMFKAKYLLTLTVLSSSKVGIVLGCSNGMIIEEIRTILVYMTTQLVTEATVEIDDPPKDYGRANTGEAPTDGKRWDCFLSHSWGQNQVTHKRVVAIAEKLKRKGLRVWVDANELTETVGPQILEGIDGSHVFVAFITQKYLLSSNDLNNNAGQEFRYAANKDVKMVVPVVMEEKLLNPNAWNNSLVKLKLASTLYIDFSSPEQLKRNLDALVNRIHKLKYYSTNPRLKPYFSNHKYNNEGIALH